MFRQDIKIFRLLVVLLLSSQLFSQFNDSSFLHRFLPNYNFINHKGANSLVSYQISNTLSYIYDDPNLQSTDIPFLLDAEFHDFDAQINFNKIFYMSFGLSVSNSGFSDAIIRDYHQLLGIDGPEYEFFKMNQNKFILNKRVIDSQIFLRPISFGIIQNLNNGSKYSFSFSYQLKSLFFTPDFIFSTQIQKRYKDFRFNARLQLILLKNDYFNQFVYSYSLAYMLYKQSISFNYYNSSPLFRENSITYDKKNIQLTTMGKNYLFNSHTAISLKFVLLENSPNISLEIIEDYINLFGKQITDTFLSHTNAPDFAIKLSVIF